MAKGNTRFIHRLVKEYGRFEKAPKGGDPFRLFQKWFTEAQATSHPEPNAMALSTISEAGFPASRMVLLKSWSHEGFVFFTNYESDKAHAIKNNKKASLLFYWGEMERQIRIEGVIKKTTRALNEYYFSQRPRNAQLAAWASPQSSVLVSREHLKKKFKTLEKTFHAESTIPCPPFWGGYTLTPHRFEFWQGQKNRLHHRLVFYRSTKSWIQEMLAP